jgi:regulator of protease activity HflC (stomatin/prohibitin superfamily)
LISFKIQYMEKISKPVNGYLAAFVAIILLGVAIYHFTKVDMEPSMLWIAIPSMIIAFFILKGLMIIQPNHTRVLTLFGKYVGSVKDNGLFFVNPFYASNKLSLRAQNLATPTLKVNDKMGNPIEIGAVIVWQVRDTYKAAYEVADYLTYVRTQSEAAVRILATSFAYDNIEDESANLTLREGGQKRK